MIFTQTKLSGAFVIEPQRLADARGFFARVFCADELKSHGLNTCVSQCNISFNPGKGTLRGMHYQAAPYQEAKLARCTMGRLYDVMIDLRPDSPTFRQWVGVELTAENRRMLYISEGFAHGYQTLEDNTEIFYVVSQSYHPQADRGVRWDDPAFGIEWPCEVTVISDKDRQFPDFVP